MEKRDIRVDVGLPASLQLEEGSAALLLFRRPLCPLQVPGHPPLGPY